MQGAGYVLLGDLGGACEASVRPGENETGAGYVLLGDLGGAGATRYAPAQPVEPIRAPLGGFVPPVAVEGLAPLQVEPVEVLGQTLPTL